MVDTSLHSLVIIAVIAALAPIAVDLRPSLRLPLIVVEIGLGIVVGPQVLDFAKETTIVDFLGNMGLAFLFFLAGFELDFERIRGRPLALATGGWVISLAIALALGAGMVSTGFIATHLLVPLCLSTTALGTLMPILRDEGELGTRFGGYILAIGAIGEFGPIVLVALLGSTRSDAVTSVVLVIFTLVAIAAAFLALRFRPPRIVRLLGTTMHASAQLPVRLSMLVLMLLYFVAHLLSLDVLLGAFAAGIVVGLVSGGEEARPLRVKLEGIGFGFLIPIFFVVTGMQFDLDALFANASTALRLPFFLVLLLVVRGVPVFLLYRRDLPRRDLPPLALFSATGLPLIVAITAIGVSTGQMGSANAAALVGAGMASVLIYPLLALALRQRGAGEEAPALGTVVEPGPRELDA